MLYNVFIDAADSVAPPGRDRAVMVPDYSAGATLLFGHFLRVDFVAIRRGREFAGRTAPTTMAGST